MIDLQKYIINAIDNNTPIDPKYVTSQMDIDSDDTVINATRNDILYENTDIRDLMLFLSDIANRYDPLNVNPAVNRVIIDVITAIHTDLQHLQHRYSNIVFTSKQDILECNVSELYHSILHLFEIYNTYFANNLELAHNDYCVDNAEFNILLIRYFRSHQIPPYEFVNATYNHLNYISRYCDDIIAYDVDSIYDSYRAHITHVDPIWYGVDIQTHIDQVSVGNFNIIRHTLDDNHVPYTSITKDKICILIYDILNLDRIHAFRELIRCINDTNAEYASIPDEHKQIILSHDPELICTSLSMPDIIKYMTILNQCIYLTDIYDIATQYIFDAIEYVLDNFSSKYSSIRSPDRIVNEFALFGLFKYNPHIIHCLKSFHLLPNYDQYIGYFNKYMVMQDEHIIDIIKHDNISEFISYTTQVNYELPFGSGKYRLDVSAFIREYTYSRNYIYDYRLLSLFDAAVYYGALQIVKYLYNTYHDDIYDWYTINTSLPYDYTQLFILSLMSTNYELIHWVEDTFHITDRHKHMLCLTFVCVCVKSGHMEILEYVMNNVVDMSLLRCGDDTKLFKYNHIASDMITTAIYDARQRKYNESNNCNTKDNTDVNSDVMINDTVNDTINVNTDDNTDYNSDDNTDNAEMIPLTITL